LLEQDGTEARVESTETLSPCDLGETTDQTVSKCWLGDESDTGSLERTEGNIGEELGGSSGSKVDGGSVVRSGLVAKVVDALLLEELVTSELESPLQEVTGEGWANTSQESTGTLILDDLTEATDETSVVCNRVELDSGLDDIDRSETTVGD